MMTTPIRTRLALAGIALAAVLPFQNCSQVTEFESVPNDKKSNTQLSGGEGYGGKVYELVSASELCADGLKPSEVRTLQDRSTVLTVRDCQTLATPETISADFWSNFTVLTYNGQTYRDEGSNSPFEPVTTPLITLQVENMTRIPTSGGGVRGEYLLITDDDYASNNVNFPQAGAYYFKVRARGSSDFAENAIMELRIDGIAVAYALTTEVAAEYSFRVNVGSGNHTVALAFINDSYDDATNADRDLYLDWLSISR